MMRSIMGSFSLCESGGVGAGEASENRALQHRRRARVITIISAHDFTGRIQARYRVALPELPHGLRLTAVEFGAGVVRLTGQLSEWEVDMPRSRLEDSISALSAVGRPLTLMWPSRDR